MIEAVTYRFGPHTTADDPTKYREDAEMEEWKKLDPVIRLQSISQARGCGRGDGETNSAEAEAIVNQAVQEAESVPPPRIEEMFRYTYAEMTPTLKEQMDDYLAFLKEKES